MMTRFFYISLLLLGMSCSGNNPFLYNVKSTEGYSYNSFIIEYGTMPHDSFPLHYAVENDTVGNSKEYSYSFFKSDGDTVVWEEGIIRTP